MTAVVVKCPCIMSKLMLKITKSDIAIRLTQYGLPIYYGTSHKE